MAISEETKLAITYADEASKRCRWIIFLLQLGVVLVLASTWEQENLSWATLRLTTAQNAVWILTCEPQSVYSKGLSPADLPVTESARGHNDALDRRDFEYRCAQKLTKADHDSAVNYIRQWNFSLAEARKNEADLQQIMNTRVMAFTVPVLGIAFDINDLSLVSGLTFTFLLSWFQFSLRRQHDNIRQVFDFAAELKELPVAYDLLAMTQVLTVPPSRINPPLPPTLARRLSAFPA
ncbi:MAG: hypothetical protein JWO13_282 [Acidobacteriales bacterium]|nr:hypothetical protein [Terriglobales bacterium]